MDSRNSQNMLTAIEGNLLALWRMLGVYSPKMRFEDRPDCMRFVSGVPHPLCNAIMRPRLDLDRADEQIEEILTPFRQRQIPFLWWLGPSMCPLDLAARLERHGLVRVEAAPGMAAETGPRKDIVMPEGFCVRAARTEREQADWLTVFAAVFELPPEAIALFAEALRRLSVDGSQPVLRQLIGYLDDAPVACGSFFIGEGVGGVYNIATQRAARGRGIGAALTAAGLAWLHTRGIRTATLQASAEGLRVYERLGFRTYCEIQMYTHS